MQENGCKVANQKSSDQQKSTPFTACDGMNLTRESR